MILQYEVNDMIEKLKEAGDNPLDGNHAIYAAKNVTFLGGLYPLEVIVSDNLPDGVACIIAKKPEHSGLQLQPPIIIKGAKNEQHK